MAAFAALMLLVGGVMAVRSRRGAQDPRADGRRPRPRRPDHHLQPHLRLQCPRALKVLVTATVVGLLTGFLGVGGGFLVVPALVLALGVPMDVRRRHLAGRHHRHQRGRARRTRRHRAWRPTGALVAALTAASVLAAVVGARIAARSAPARLSAAFTGLVLAVAVVTATQALPALV